MSNPFDSALKRAAFDGIEFPVESVSMRGGLREHVHEYPHTDGGDSESLGRKLYEIEMVCSFHTVWKKYPDLWPKRLNDLFFRFESARICPLVIPTVGTIDARCVDWDRRLMAKLRTGEASTFKFREVLTGTVFDLVEFRDSANLPAKARALRELVAKDNPSLITTIFDKIALASNAIARVNDKVERFENRVEAKAQLVVELCRQADRTERMLEEPRNHRIVHALHELEVAARQIADHKIGSGARFTYVVPAKMGMPKIAAQIYGATDRVVELLFLNPVDDVFAVPAGTQIRYSK